MASGALRDEVKLMIGAAGIDPFFRRGGGGRRRGERQTGPDAYLKALAGLNAKHPGRNINRGMPRGGRFQASACCRRGRPE